MEPTLKTAAFFIAWLFFIGLILALLTGGKPRR